MPHYVPSQNRSRDSGPYAEKIACQWLLTRGFSILRRNWRKRFFEIDIIAYRPPDGIHPDGMIVFFEVKYRRSLSYGYPEEYVDNAKLHKLKLGAAVWMAASALRQDSDYDLGIIAVAGPFYQIERVIVGL